MDHSRKQIRDAVVDKLTTAGIVGGRIYNNIMYALSAEKIPGIIVYTQSEISSRETFRAGNDNISRNLDLVIYIVATGDDVQDQLDAIAVDVENLLAAEPDLNIGIRDLFLSRSDLDKTSLGNNDAAALVLTYQLTYSTKATESQTIL